MSLLIERRNFKFSNSLSVFINRCVADNEDPAEKLKKETTAFIPAPTISTTSAPQSLWSTPFLIVYQRCAKASPRLSRT
jgi:hypothetical protein